MMLKNIKKLACLVLALILSLTCFLPMAAGAESVSSEKQIPAEKSAFSFSGSECANKLSARMESYGVEVKDDTLFQVVKSSDGTNTLVVTNINGAEVSQNMFMVLEDDGDVISMPTNAGNQSRGINDGYGDDIDDIFADGSFTFRWAILYDYHVLGGSFFCRPKHAQFVCLYSASAGYTVYDALLDFNVTGTEYDSNFNSLGGPYDFSHSIVVSQAVVARNTYYSKTNAYNANRWICYSGGYGQFVVIANFELNGRLYYHTTRVGELLPND